MYKIKQIPEDFVVKERIKLRFDEKGQYSYFLLKKRNYTTERAVSMVAEKLRVKRKYINYAGNKDKKAVTEQVISVNSSTTKEFRERNMEIKYFS